MIKVLIVDDESIMGESLKLLIEQDHDMKVVGCTTNGQAALKLCDELLPDVVLMDIVMPVCDGIEGTKLIKAKHVQTKVLILTTFHNDENLSRALQAGADGYILKDIKSEELWLAIKSVAQGLGVLNKGVFNTVEKQLPRRDEETKLTKEYDNINLTEREISILRLLVDGKNNREIATELFLTEGSVKNVISTVLSKYNLKDRTQLAIFAIKNNLV